MDNIPALVVFALSVAAVMIAIEGGYRVGQRVYNRTEDEKESSVSAISGAILGLLAFILAFTFAIVSDRFDARKALVRDEANALRTAYSRSEFLPQPDRNEAKTLLRRYVDDRVAVVQSNDLDQVLAGLDRADRTQRRLWDMAVANARLDMNSDVAALYIEALNEVMNVHALRVAIGIQARIPPTVWLVLIALILLGMIGVGYQTAIAGSRRTWVTLFLALSFSLVIMLIVELDRPQAGSIAVSQQPLIDVKAWMDADPNGP